MKPITITEAKAKKDLEQLLRDFMTLAFAVTHMPQGGASILTRVIASMNHMLNVALALAAAAQLPSELVTEALERGEQTARALIDASIKQVKDHGGEV